MTDINTPPPVPENDNTTPVSSSPWVMLITMLLLISGLILSSAILVHYAMDGKEGADGKSIVDFSRLFLGEGKELSAESQAAEKQAETATQPSDQAASNPSDSSFFRFFSGKKDDGTVHWPKLKVSGFGKSTDTEAGFAIINGKHVLVNSSIGEVKLVEIRAQGALVEYKGEQKVLTVESVR